MTTAQWQADRAKVAERAELVTAFARAAIEVGMALQPDWPASLSDVLAELEQIVRRDAHPDDVDRARAGIAALASMFAPVEQVEAVYLGDKRL